MQLCWNDLLQAVDMVSRGLGILAITRGLLKPWFIFVISSLREVWEGSCPGGMHTNSLRSKKLQLQNILGSRKTDTYFFPNPFTLPTCMGTGHSQTTCTRDPVYEETHAQTSSNLFAWHEAWHLQVSEFLHFVRWVQLFSHIENKEPYAWNISRSVKHLVALAEPLENLAQCLPKLCLVLARQCY